MVLFLKPDWSVHQLSGKRDGRRPQPDQGHPNPDAFLAVLNELTSNELTNDYWAITLPAQLATSSARNPQLFAYIASQNRIAANVLFSHKKVSELLDPALKTKKKPLERHHLFPRAYLEEHVTEDQTEINQTANYALLEWPENIDIGKNRPRNTWRTSGSATKNGRTSCKR